MKHKCYICNEYCNSNYWICYECREGKRIKSIWDIDPKLETLEKYLLENFEHISIKTKEKLIELLKK